MGHIVDWRCRIWQAIDDPLLLKAFTCHKALLTAHSNRLQYVVIEGDSSLVIAGCKSDTVPLQINKVIQDIVQLSSVLQEVQFLFVKCHLYQTA